MIQVKTGNAPLVPYREVWSERPPRIPYLPVCSRVKCLFPRCVHPTVVYSCHRRTAAVKCGCCSYRHRWRGRERRRSYLMNAGSNKWVNPARFSAKWKCVNILRKPRRHTREEGNGSSSGAPSQRCDQSQCRGANMKTTTTTTTTKHQVGDDYRAKNPGIQPPLPPRTFMKAGFQFIVLSGAWWMAFGASVHWLPHAYFFMGCNRFLKHFKTGIKMVPLDYGYLWTYRERVY